MRSSAIWRPLSSPRYTLEGLRILETFEFDECLDKFEARALLASADRLLPGEDGPSLRWGEQMGFDSFKFADVLLPPIHVHHFAVRLRAGTGPWGGWGQ